MKSETFKILLTSVALALYVGWYVLLSARDVLEEGSKYPMELPLILAAAFLVPAILGYILGKLTTRKSAGSNTDENGDW